MRILIVNRNLELVNRFAAVVESAGHVDCSGSARLQSVYRRANPARNDIALKRSFKGSPARMGLVSVMMF